MSPASLGDVKQNFPSFFLFLLCLELVELLESLFTFFWLSGSAIGIRQMIVTLRVVGIDLDRLLKFSDSARQFPVLDQ